MSTDVSQVRPIEILMVEDDSGDALLTQEAFRDGKIHNTLHVVRDGVEAMQFLRREGPYTEAPRPDLILLDLNLPRMDGREVLEEIKSDTELKTIPVVILTTSDADRDVLMSYRLHANCYVTKPVDFEQFRDVVRSVQQFWISIVRRPSS